MNPWWAGVVGAVLGFVLGVDINGEIIARRARREWDAWWERHQRAGREDEA